MAYPRSRSYLAGEIQLIFSTQSWQRIDCVYVVFKGFSTTTIYIYIIFTYDSACICVLIFVYDIDI